MHLTPTEFKLLARLVRSRRPASSRIGSCSPTCGARSTSTHTHYLRLYMAQLRAKLEAEPSEPRHLLTETGVGYRLVVD